MKLMIISTDYEPFLNWMYSRHPSLSHRSFAEQQRVRASCMFGVAQFYGRNLTALGHETLNVYANNRHMQQAWLHDSNPAYPNHSWKETAVEILRRASRHHPLFDLKSAVRRLARNNPSWNNWIYDVLRLQITTYVPDVIINLAMDTLDNSFFRTVKERNVLLVGQHAATPLRDASDLSAYDLTLSSFPPTIEWFRRKGLDARYLPLGFDPWILQELGPATESAIDVSFVGSLAPIHASRIAWLEAVCRRVRVQIWSPDISSIAKGSSIRDNYMGPAWGYEMFRILRSSRVTLNHHGDIADYANNCRLFEATGSGTLLVTDWKPDLNRLFDTDREVLAYRNAEHCADLVMDSLNDEPRRRAIAAAGQARTLHDHTYESRMEELVSQIKTCLGA